MCMQNLSQFIQPGARLSAYSRPPIPSTVWKSVELSLSAVAAECHPLGPADICHHSPQQRNLQGLTGCQGGPWGHCQSLTMRSHQRQPSAVQLLPCMLWHSHMDCNNARRFLAKASQLQHCSKTIWTDPVHIRRVPQVTRLHLHYLVRHELGRVEDELFMDFTSCTGWLRLASGHLQTSARHSRPPCAIASCKDTYLKAP